MKRLLLALAILLGIATPAFAAPVEDPAKVPDAVAAWFSEKAQATVRSYGQQAFPDLMVEDIAALTVGSPQLTSVMGNGKTPETAIQPASRWIAPIMSGESAVGAVSVNFSDGIAGDEIVRGDARLGSAIARGNKDTNLVWDTRFDAWYLQRGTRIEPADSAGANIVLGSVPLGDFLKQRERILSGPEPVSAQAEDPIRPAARDGRSFALTLAMILGVIAILVGSLVWLRAEQQGREGAQNSDELSGTQRTGSQGDSASKTRFRDSAKKINVYRTKKAKDDSDLPDD
ncbi:hypothetical protein J2S70_000439 [Trueperella bonasi]|uniref:Uncharacterized protein n=1 Tax=Trueperella bonasi TaxID=312286 RepID=A0ABT9NF81_9ACTO|nr:hypothetical protein [Trueperella bonasi]MDP9805857.1 hypothetical protein [Trueperella bonasi]